MATIVVVFKILFLVLIAHNSFVVTLPEQAVLIRQNETSVDSGNDEALKERFERANITGHELASARIEEGEKWWPASDLRIKRHNKSHSNSEEQANASNDNEDEDSLSSLVGKDATTVDSNSPKSSSRASEEESAVIVDEEIGSSTEKGKVESDTTTINTKNNENKKESTQLPLDRRLGDRLAASKWLEVSSSSDEAKFKSVRNDDDEAIIMKDIEREPSVSISSTKAPAASVSATTSADGLEDRRDQVNYAELCYLSNGGSSLTLTVNEATQVGAVIGTVEVSLSSQKVFLSVRIGLPV